MGAPVEMTVSRKNGDGLNNVRSNLVVATRSVSAARAVNVLKRGNFKPAGEPIENKVRKVLADTRHVCELVHFGGIKGAAGRPNS
jgi:hypothetical protein